MDSLYLEHILNSVRRIESYTKGIIYNDYYENEMMQDAIIRNIEIIGEAAGRLSSNLKKKFDYIPWVDIKNMRNYLIHAYFNIDIEQVWNVVQKDIPALKIQIVNILQKIEPDLKNEK